MSEDTQLVQACQRCWRRKQRCGRERPSCAQCIASNAECVPRIWGKVLEESGNVSVEEQMSTRSVIEQMKSRIAFLEHQQASPISMELNASETGQRSESASLRQSNDDGRYRAEYGSLSSAANEVEYLSVAAMAGPDSQDVQIEDGLNFAVLVGQATKLSLHPRHPSQDMSKVSSDLRDLQSELESSCDHDLEFFVDIYCQRLGQLYPCISRNSCYEALNTALHLEESSESLQQHYSMGEAVLLVCLTASLGVLNSPDYRAARRTVHRLKDYALNLLSIVIRESTDTNAILFLLLASHLCLHNFEKAAAWYLIGLAFSKAISSGLHRFRTPPDDHSEDLTLFWTLYKVDRIFSFVLGTPFSIEDGDMTVQLPQTTWSHEVDSSRISLRHYSVWAVHCVHMMSDWRKQSRTDLAVCYSSLSYWRETSSDLIKSAQLENNSESISIATIMSAKETQLTCRALTYLLLEASSAPLQPALLDRIGADLDREVPQLLTKYRAMLDAQVLGPTLIDAFDIIGSVCAYVCSRQLAVRRQLQNGSAAGNTAIGVAGMRIITSCMDVLRQMSERHAAVLQLQEILWSFLSVLEEQAPYTNPDAVASIQANFLAVNETLSRCSLPVPRHLVQLMHRALG